MPQSPIATQPFGKNPSGVAVPIQVDANGYLLVNSAADENYVSCPASATTTLQTTAGAKGDYLDHIVVSPTAGAAGNVQIKDGALAAITVYTGGVGNVTTGAPLNIPLGAPSVNGAWQVITGANVTALAFGRFS